MADCLTVASPSCLISEGRSSELEVLSNRRCPVLVEVMSIMERVHWVGLEVRWATAERAHWSSSLSVRDRGRRARWSSSFSGAGSFWLSSPWWSFSVAPICGMNSHRVLVHREAFPSLFIKQISFSSRGWGTLRDPGSNVANELAPCQILGITVIILSWDQIRSFLLILLSSKYVLSNNTLL